MESDNIVADIPPRQTVEFGGRRFTVIDFDLRNIDLDLHLRRVIRESGLDRVLPAQEEEAVAFLVRMQAAVIDCGRGLELIGCYLLPEGAAASDWTPAMALQTAQLIGRCNAPEERDLVNELVAQVVFGFFRLGLEQLQRFQRSLAASPAPVTLPSVH